MLCRLNFHEKECTPSLTQELKKNSTTIVKFSENFKPLSQAISFGEGGGL